MKLFLLLFSCIVIILTITPRHFSAPQGLDPCSTYNSSCDFCLSHYVDRQCGYCYDSNKTYGYCMMIKNKKGCKTDFYYGVLSKCPPNPTPTPTPTPSSSPTTSPTPFPTFDRSDCKDIYTDCYTCRSHFFDRSCGWCNQEGGSQCYYGTADGPAGQDKCDQKNWVYGPKSLGCDKQPTPTPSLSPTKNSNNPKDLKYVIIGLSIGGGLIIIILIVIGVLVHRKNTRGGYQFVGDFVRAEENFWDDQVSDSETDIDTNKKGNKKIFGTDQILDVTIDSENENMNQINSTNSSNSSSNSNSQSFSSSYSSSTDIQDYN
ncbi:bifunctional inhibitor/lipid-transfer protein/seed storage 2s albumin superfamily protein [Anaeramoeba flamelloides]|uniref:Bifunctional inhibitor/lipid-transfer protein/seed storage 2s albumin superfamily protein n=1 Tax=Anaeramoeba flamelloides TaxID=1746091 RepID=A0AAV7Y656_9EUKA|nr:bifunctional inhibitor/lipid-transfer protein/seed storage 2s albumin superfamily protein [Anaeramoeba flamelloides]